MLSYQIPEPADTFIPRGCIDLKHDKLGSFELFHRPHRQRRAGILLPKQRSIICAILHRDFDAGTSSLNNRRIYHVQPFVGEIGCSPENFAPAAGRSATGQLMAIIGQSYPLQSYRHDIWR